MQSRPGIPILAAVITGALVGGFLGDRFAKVPALEERSARLLLALEDAKSIIEGHYVEPVSIRNLDESAVQGLLRTLDPHSAFFTSRDYSQLQEEQQGRYYGLGILIRPAAPSSGRVVIVEPPSPDSPGYKAGLRVGDIISKIEGEAIDGWNYPDEIVPRLKGPKGTRVNISVERRGAADPIDISVERDEIPLHTVKYAFRIRPGIGYVRITRFSETTANELDGALEKLDEGTLEGFILDLRGNPGGALRQAIAVADRFLSAGQLIVSTRSRKGQVREYRAPRGRKHNYPMVVLINENSASASEIVAGAFQDHGRALIVGQRSFGKALVQTVYPLSGRQGLALTTGRYYTPNNRLIQREYSDSLYDYYYYSTAGSRGEPLPGGDLDRTSQGGIAPDEKVDRMEPDGLGRLGSRHNYFYEFAGDLWEDPEFQRLLNSRFPERHNDLTFSQKHEMMNQVFAAGQVVRGFKGFLRTKNIPMTRESFEESRELIENELKREFFLRTFGDGDSFRLALGIDRQVQRALELLPTNRALGTD